MGRRQPGEAGFLHRGVAVAALDPEAPDMVLVAKGHGLFKRDALAGDVGGVLQRHQQPGKAEGGKNESDEGEACHERRPARKKLRSCGFTWRADSTGFIAHRSSAPVPVPNETDCPVQPPGAATS